MTRLNAQAIETYIAQLEEETLPPATNKYLHRGMPARTMNVHHKNFDRSTLKPTDRSLPSDSFRITKNSFKKKTSCKSVGKLPIKPKLNTYGRKLFAINPEMPGPGSYDAFQPMDSRYGYIHKETLESLDKKLQASCSAKKQLKSSLGPGKYDIQRTEFLSFKKTIPLGKFAEGKCDRKVLPSSVSSTLIPSSKPIMQPGPTDYEPDRCLQSNSLFQRPAVHQISTTQRSSLLQNTCSPGPGAYEWVKVVPSFGEKNKKKPMIEYKFVYGHPS